MCAHDTQNALSHSPSECVEKCKYADCGYYKNKVLWGVPGTNGSSKGSPCSGFAISNVVIRGKNYVPSAT